MKYELLNKAIFFPDQKILVFPDMHLGYENMLKEAGNVFPQFTVKEIFEELTSILEELTSKRKIKLSKVIFLGDIKHYFAFNKSEKNIIFSLLELMQKYIEKKDIILIKGNHEKLNVLQDKDFLDYYKFKNIAFMHGDIEIKEVTNDKSIEFICIGHLHPAISLADKQKIRKEKYKCFLIGRYKNKTVFILPSFQNIVEGHAVNENLSDNNCFIKSNTLKNFSVFAIGKKEILNFGKIKNLKNM